MDSSDQTLFDNQPLQIIQDAHLISNLSDLDLSSPEFERDLTRAKRSSSVESQSNQSTNSTVTSIVNPVSPSVDLPLTDAEIVKLTAWRGDQSYGTFIEGTKIMPCKAFLNNNKWQNYLDPSERFKLLDLVEDLGSKGIKINTIIDLNRSFDYYCFDEVKRECPLLAETNYIKFKLENAAVPADEVVDDVFEVLLSAQEKNEVVVIHCFNGINRTGYIVANFLCKFFNIDGDEAVRRFERARNHKIKHGCMTEKLRKKFPVKDI
jgi:atypical dual specificity phosphatase